MGWMAYGTGRLERGRESQRRGREIARQLTVARNSSESIMSLVSVSSSTKSALLLASISSVPPRQRSSARTEQICANCMLLRPHPSAFSSNDVHSFSIAAVGTELAMTKHVPVGARQSKECGRQSPCDMAADSRPTGSTDPMPRPTDRPDAAHAHRRRDAPRASTSGGIANTYQRKKGTHKRRSINRGCQPLRVLPSPGRGYPAWRPHGARVVCTNATTHACILVFTSPRAQHDPTIFGSRSALLTT